MLTTSVVIMVLTFIIRYFEIKLCEFFVKDLLGIFGGLTHPTGNLMMRENWPLTWPDVTHHALTIHTAADMVIANFGNRGSDVCKAGYCEHRLLTEYRATAMSQGNVNVRSSHLKSESMRKFVIAIQPMEVSPATAIIIVSLKVPTLRLIAAI